MAPLKAEIFQPDQQAEVEEILKHSDLHVLEEVLAKYAFRLIGVGDDRLPVPDDYHGLVTSKVATYPLDSWPQTRAWLEGRVEPGNFKIRLLTQPNDGFNLDTTGATKHLTFDKSTDPPRISEYNPPYDMFSLQQKIDLIGAVRDTLTFIGMAS